jgi:hypothetical protein
MLLLMEGGFTLIIGHYAGKITFREGMLFFGSFLPFAFINQILETRVRSKEMTFL